MSFESLFHRWENPENEVLKQSINIFGGNIKTEVPLAAFLEVSVWPRGDSGNAVKGIFYLTSKRFVFLPRNTLFHQYVCEAEFFALKTLSGSVADFTLSLVDLTGSIARFQFPDAKSLFLCFSLLTKLAESSKIDENALVRTALEVSVGAINPVPFSTIEVELEEAKMQSSQKEITVKSEEIVDRTAQLVAPFQSLFARLGGLELDIHMKFQILCVVSFIAFCLQYVQFSTLTALLLLVVLLYSAWKSINANDEDEATSQPEEGTAGIVRTMQFIREWFLWDNPRNGVFLIEIAATTVILSILLPGKLYHMLVLLIGIACVVANAIDIRHMRLFNIVL